MSRWRLVTMFALVVPVLASCDRGARAESQLSLLGQVPEVALVDQDGAAVRTADLAGRVLIANFIFTRCPTVCPVTSLKMKRVGERLAGEEGIGLVSISVDPEHDTPAVLREYAARFQAAPARWRFLTGDARAVEEAAVKGFRLHIARKGVLPDGTPDIVHDLHFVLIDRKLGIRGYYDSDVKERLDDLVEDARRLARE